MPIVRIEMWSGRTAAQKRELARVITDAMVNIAHTKPEATIIIFEDIAQEDWAQEGKLAVSGDALTYKLKGEDTTYTTKRESGDTVRGILVAADIKPGDPNYPEVNIKGTSAWKTILSVLLTFAPIVIIIGVLFFFLRQ